MQVTDDDLAGDFAILIFADPANYKAALENVSRLQDITELSGVLPAPHTRGSSMRTLRCGMLCMSWGPARSAKWHQCLIWDCSCR